MEEFKASDVAGKDVNGEKSVEDTSSVKELSSVKDAPTLESTFKKFKSIQNTIMRHALYIFPGLILFIIFFILVKIPYNAGVVMYISGLLAAALSLLAFSVLMKMIPETFRSLWSRKIIVGIEETSSWNSPQKMIDEKNSEVAVRESRRLEERFGQFILKLQTMLNHPYQWAMGLAFSLLVFTWNWSHQIEFLIAFVIGLMAWRMIVTSIYIWELGKNFILEPKLGHPDKCGGLSPLGNLCLWNALIINIPAIHLGGWLLMQIFMERGSPFFELSKTYTSVYLQLLSIIVLFAVVTFFLPLLKAHWLMEEWKNNKQKRLDEIEQSINQMESRLLNETEKLDQKEFESIQKELERMQQVYKRNEKLPVWPFNMGIMIKFLISQIIPILGIISQVVSLLKLFTK